MPALITINGQEITPNPDKVPLGKFIISNAQRNAKGKMLMDIIERKRQISLEWGLIGESNLRVILDLLDSAVFHTVTYPDPQGTNGVRTMSAYVGDTQMDTWHRVQGIRYYKDVKIALIEQ